METNNEKYSVLKKRIYTICDSYQPAFKKFVLTVENLPDKRNLILECASMLNDPEVVEKKIWRDFAVLFNNHYKGEILAYLGLKKSVSAFPPIQVSKVKLFLEHFSEMKQCGVFGGHTAKELAQCIHATFDTKYAVSTIRTRLGDLPEELND